MDNENKHIEETNDNINDNIIENQTELATPEANNENQDFSDTTLDNILESEHDDSFFSNTNDLNLDLTINDKLIIPKKSNKRILQGVVVSSKPDKTIVVKIVRQVAHPLYKKYYKRSKKIMAHDELNECNIGDTVKVIESRPISKMKRWSLIEIIERAK